MAKVHNAKEQKRALNELLKRYEDRGMTYDRSRENVERGNDAHKKSLANASVASNGGLNSRKRKDGASKKEHITDKEFAARFKASREYVPKANVDLERTILLQKVAKPKSEKGAMPIKSKKSDIRKKLMAEANRNNPKTPSQKKTMEGISNARQKKTNRSI